MTIPAAAIQAVLQEAGFRIASSDAVLIAAQHLVQTEVWIRAAFCGDDWQYHAVHDGTAYPIAPRSLPELIYLLHRSYGWSAGARRN